MQTITPFLWFNDQAEEAAKFYTSVFPNSGIGGVSRGPDGNVMVVPFTLNGQPYLALNGGPQFRFNESVSFVVPCEDQEEIDRFWNALTADGGSESRCGWLKDRFGLSWQIVPKHLGSLMSGPRAGAVMQAMMPMNKLDIALLEAASRG